MEFLKQNLETQQEEPVFSLRKRDELKLADFKQYLIKSETLLALVKFLLSLRNSKNRPEDPILALQDYFGNYRDPQWNEVEQLLKDIESFKIDNLNRQNQIDQLQIELNHQLKLQQERQAEEAERLAQEAAKGAKKGGKK